MQKAMMGLELPVMYSILAILISMTTRVTSYSTPQEVHSSLISNLDTVTSHLGTLSRSIRSVHSDISARQLDECRIMGPMSDSICSVLENEDKLQQKTLLDQLIHSPLAPGKRSGNGDTDAEKRKLLVEDLVRKQKLLENILSSIDEAQQSIQTERKRSCNLNLGFHCQTEHYSAVADMYNWLQSSLSPGKRRRRAAEEDKQ